MTLTTSFVMRKTRADLALLRYTMKRKGLLSAILILTISVLLALPRFSGAFVKFYVPRGDYLSVGERVWNAAKHFFNNISEDKCLERSMQNLRENNLTVHNKLLKLTRKMKSGLHHDGYLNMVVVKGLLNEMVKSLYELKAIMLTIIKTDGIDQRCKDKFRKFLENPELIRVLDDAEDWKWDFDMDMQSLSSLIPDPSAFIYIPSPSESTLPTNEILRQQGINYGDLDLNLKNTLNRMDAWVWDHRDEVRDGLMIAGITAIAIYNLPSLANLLKTSLSPEMAPAFLFITATGDNIFCTPDENEEKPIKEMSDYYCELKPKE